MHILFLTQILPYPPDSGPKVKTWHVLKYLSQSGHKITLASFIRPEEEPYVETVREICSQVHVVPIKRSRLADIGYLLRSQFSGRPFLIERDDIHEMRSLVNGIVEAESVDVIHADQLTMTQFALPFAHRPDGKPALVFDAHNAVWTIVKRMNETLPFYYKIPLFFEAKRIKEYEAMIVAEFNSTLAVAEPDRKALIEAVTEYHPKLAAEDLPISVIPIAVDTQKIQPVPRQTDFLNILTMGTLYYPPNADGIRWFIQDVFPLVQEALPDVKLTVVGKNPPKDFLRFSEESNGRIAITGYVPELDPYFAASTIMVIPVRAGGGMRVRILEAFARAMPVVTTTVGLEGIEAEPGLDVLVADTPDEFSRSVIDLLGNKDLQTRLAMNGRRLAEGKYDWQVVLSHLENVYKTLS
jgi:glycosyltransferase involved in cell wall biosynthesis